MNKDELKKFLLDIFGKLDDKQLLALTIYGEARGESRSGKIAVGSVILERVEHRGWDGDTIHEVCLMPYQFSCYLPADPNFPALKLLAQEWEEQYALSSTLRECYAVASGLIEGAIAPIAEIVSHSCCQYVTMAWRRQLDARAVNEKDPAEKAALDKKRWWKNMELCAVVGHHEFYA